MTKSIEYECPYRDEIKDLHKEIPELKKTLDSNNKTLQVIFNRLFVEDPENGDDKCSLVIEVRKNTKFRRAIEDERLTERRNKWRRRGFYVSLIGLILSNLFIIYNLFFMK